MAEKNTESFLSTPPYTVYSETLDRVWEEIDAIHQDADEYGTFNPRRYHSDVVGLRLELGEAIADRSSDEDGQAFRDYHAMRFLHQSIDSIIYTPQLIYTDNEQRTYWRSTLSLGFQYSAVRSIIDAQADPTHTEDKSHQQYYAGFVNEQMPIALLNRPHAVSQSHAVVMPASRIDDHTSSTDLRMLRISNPTDNLAIQVKTRLSTKERPLIDGVTIYAKDYDNVGYRAMWNVIKEHRQPTHRLRKELNAVSAQLLARITHLRSPEGQAHTHKELQTARRIERRSRPYTPMMQSIGAENPDLEQLRIALADEAAS